MKNAIRKPHKDVQVSKWVFLLAYTFIVLTVSCSFTLAKYITTGTIEDSARVATAGEYVLYISNDPDDPSNLTLKNDNIRISETISADSANDELLKDFCILNKPSETAVGYSIILVQCGKLPVNLTLTPLNKTGEGIIANQPDQALIDEYTARYIANGYTEENGYKISVVAYSNGYVPANIRSVHYFQLKSKWQGVISTDYTILESSPDDYNLENDNTIVDIYVVINQLDNEIED